MNLYKLLLTHYILIWFDKKSHQPACSSLNVILSQYSVCVFGVVVWAACVTCVSREAQKLCLGRLTPGKLNTSSPRQNGRHFADKIFKRVFLNEHEFPLIFLLKGAIKNIAVLVLIMAWRRPGDKPVSEPIVVRLPTHMCVNRPMS